MSKYSNRNIQTKHHWWWKSNQIFGNLKITADFTGWIHLKRKPANFFWIYIYTVKTRNYILKFIWCCYWANSFISNLINEMVLVNCLHCKITVSRVHCTKLQLKNSILEFSGSHCIIYIIKLIYIYILRIYKYLYIN